MDLSDGNRVDIKGQDVLSLKTKLPRESLDKLSLSGPRLANDDAILDTIVVSSHGQMIKDVVRVWPEGIADLSTALFYNELPGLVHR